MNFLKIKETCLYVHDLEVSRKFYCGTLGLSEISYVKEKHLFLRAGHSVLLLFNPEDSKNKISPPAHYGGGKQHFAFEVADGNYMAAKAEVISKGISVTEEITWKSGKKSFYFNDPEGNVLEIVPDTGIWE
jgi:catechol 2,3-dioxygenase-like lactoylglutathione lyase family enzyme